MTLYTPDPATQDNSSEFAEKVDFYHALRKARRILIWEPGNRTQYVAAKTYFAMIKREFQTAQDLCDMLEEAGRPGDADHIWKRTQRIIDIRRHNCNVRAIRILRDNPAAQHLTTTHAIILGAMMLFGFQTGYCCAAQESIGKAAGGFSRQTANSAIKALEEAEVIKRVNYDWRGTITWTKDGAEHQITKWCIVFEVPMIAKATRIGPTPVAFADDGENRAEKSQNPPGAAKASKAGVWDSVKQTRRRRSIFKDYPDYIEYQLPHEDP